MAVIWLYDLYADFTRFERTSRPNGFALLLYLMPLAYPLFSLARGLSFPMMTMPVMPCSVAVFTIGLMLAFTHRINIFLVLFLCHWALIGLAKVYFFGIPEDFLLAASTVPALYLFFREYIAKNRELRTKPDARMLNGLLILLCIVIGLFFTATLSPDKYETDGITDIAGAQPRPARRRRGLRLRVAHHRRSRFGQDARAHLAHRLYDPKRNQTQKYFGNDIYE